MDWSFDETKLGQWSWLEMVAQLDDESMKVAVEGEQGRSRGLIGCELLPRPGSYDHKRHHQLKMAGRPERSKQLSVWDFVLRRDDGSALRLHPQWGTPKVETYALEGHDPPVQPPVAGLGGSDGPGTYRHFKDQGTQMFLRFDASKRP